MVTLSCPSCGANVNFHLQSSVFAVCSYCRSTLVRQDMNLESIGKMADLQDDLTPLKVSCTGSYEGQRFELIGRLKVGYSEGFWNEWYALFNDERVGWLAEAQGFYAMCFPLRGVSLPDRKKLLPGSTVELGSQGVFVVEDMRKVECLLSEGELPVNAVRGRKSLSVDLTAPGCRMATIEYAESETRVFAGRYQDFDDFRFSNLRFIHGW